MYYLYKKTHQTTGIMYLGQTKNNPMKYKGSGLYWRNHLKIHGDHVLTEIIKECITREELRWWGEYYSNIWDVVKSEQWANLKPEIGDGGSPKGINLGRKHSANTKSKISSSKKGKPAPWASVLRTNKQKEHLRNLNLGKKHTPESKSKMIETKKKNGSLCHSEHTKIKMQKPKDLQTVQRMKLAQQRRRQFEEKRRYITNGTDNKLILESDIIPDGWIIGRTTETVPPSQKGKFWINNGTENKMSTIVPYGWVKGRLKSNKE